MTDFRHAGIAVYWDDFQDSIDLIEMMFDGVQGPVMEENTKFLNKCAPYGFVSMYARTCKITIGSGIVEVLSFSNRESKLPLKLEDSGLTHLAFTVPSVDALHERIKKMKEIFIHAKPQISPDNRVKLMFVYSRMLNCNFELVEELSIK